MSEAELAKQWKDGAATEPGPDHPAGTIEVAPRSRAGLRAAVLAGLNTGAGLAYGFMLLVPPTTDPGTTPTVSSIMI